MVRRDARAWPKGAQATLVLDEHDTHALYGRTRWLRQVALDLTRDSDLAEDLVQDTLVAWLRRPRHIEPAGDGWLRTVLRNLHVDRVRARRRRGTEAISLDAATTDAGPDHRVEAAHILRTLDRAIDALSEPFRTTLRLSYLEDLASGDVARRLGVPAATVRRRNQIALKHLRRRLGRTMGGDDRAALSSSPRPF